VKPQSQTLEQLALDAMKNSYSPYSQKQVGASLELESGEVFQGCNIENSSFGGTVCAERVAVWNAVSTHGPNVRIKRVVVATDASPPWFPCGLCRQVVNEFATSDCRVTLVNTTGEVLEFTFKELLPHGFDRWK
jgi:cytidine deaminase